jgi:hypothetical protein
LCVTAASSVSPGFDFLSRSSRIRSSPSVISLRSGWSEGTFVRVIPQQYCAGRARYCPLMYIQLCESRHSRSCRETSVLVNARLIKTDPIGHRENLSGKIKWPRTAARSPPREPESIQARAKDRVAEPWESSLPGRKIPGGLGPRHII